MELNTIGVVGAGVMGSGVAQVSAAAGYFAVVQDTDDSALERAKSGIESISEKDLEAAMGRIQYTTELEKACQDADLVVEAVFEDLGVKQELFEKIEQIAGPDAILASNTSALPITEIASVSDRADKIIGIHFMNPVPLMKGVEIIRGQLTSDETFETALDYIRSLGKEPIPAVDYAGFIVSRLVDVLMNEAVKMVQEGNRPEDIDKAMEMCAGHPMGPCKLLDLVGAEIAMHGMQTMARDFGDGYKPHHLLKKRVLAGLLGRKTGRGFYDYKP
ncbi:MAG: 3-hydroxyacyl-CoA dehydrogenase family protein [Desulfobacterales bacterium]